MEYKNIFDSIYEFIKKQNKYPDKIFPFNKNEKRKRNVFY